MIKKDFEKFKQFSVLSCQLRQAIKDKNGDKMSETAGKMLTVVSEIKNKSLRDLLDKTFDYILIEEKNEA